MIGRARGALERGWAALHARPAAPRLVLGGAMAFAVGLIVVWAGDRIFVIDEWEYVVRRIPWTAETLLRPANGHLLALPLAVYKGLLSTFGATSHVPFTILTIVLDLTIVALIYAIAARRIGPWPALIPAVLILFYGAGWEVMLNTAAMQNQFGIAAGLGMILCLDRRDRRGDIAAGLLLVVSLASFTIGLAFAAGAAVRILAERPPGGSLRRLALAAGPVVLYAVWWVWASRYDQVVLSLYSVGSVGGGVFDQIRAITAGISGLFRLSGGGDTLDEALLIDISRTEVIALAVIGFVGYRLVRGPRLTPPQASALAIGAVYLLLVASGISDVRPPSASRYVYMGSVVFAVAATELAAGLRVPRAWRVAVALAVAVSLLANVAEIRQGGRFFERESAYNQAELTALEIARDHVDPGTIPEPKPQDLYPHQDLVFTAAEYFTATAAYGSPAETEAELAVAPEDARGGADRLLYKLLDVGIAGSERPSRSAAPPVVTALLNAEVETDGSCVVASPGPAGRTLGVIAEVPADGLVYSAEAKPASFRLGRFDPQLPVRLQGAPATGTLQIPADRSSRPWLAGLQLTGPAKLCTAGG